MKHWLFFLVVALQGCAWPTGVGEERRVATISYYGDPVRIELPTTVSRGENFTVRVTTYGGGCIRKGNMVVELAASAAELTTYDHEVSHTMGGVCTDDLRLYEHTATMRFHNPGTARITVHGVERPSGKMISVERMLLVH